MIIVLCPCIEATDFKFKSINVITGHVTPRNMPLNVAAQDPDEQCPASRCFYGQQQLYFAASSLAAPSMQGTHCMSGETLDAQIRGERWLECVWPSACTREVLLDQTAPGLKPAAASARHARSLCVSCLGALQGTLTNGSSSSSCCGPLCCRVRSPVSHYCWPN